MYVSDTDPTSAEFIRLYTSKDFYGTCLLRALEREEEQQGSKEREKQEQQKRTIPQLKDDIGGKVLYMQHFEIIYGYRPPDPVIFLLNV